jgi:hypothetical protein
MFLVRRGTLRHLLHQRTVPLEENRRRRRSRRRKEAAAVYLHAGKGCSNGPIRAVVSDSFSGKAQIRNQILTVRSGLLAKWA